MVQDRSSHFFSIVPILPFLTRFLTYFCEGVLNSTPWIRDDFLKVLASKTPGMSPYMDEEDASDIKLEDEYF